MRPFLALHFLLWTLVGLVRRSIAMDTAEAMVWGGEWTFGTNKHPYLSGWVAEAGRLACGGSAKLAAALLASGCTTLGIYAVYRLALRFTDRSRALAAAMLLEGSVYYSACALEYNCNMLSLALVPAFLLFFHRAAEDGGCLRDWLLTGVLAGAMLMTKYTNGVFLFCAAVYAVCAARRVFRDPGLYLAGLACIAVCLPHLQYLFDTDFAVLGYFARRSQTEGRWWGHLVYPLKFLGSQAAACWGVVGFAVWALWRGRGTSAGGRPLPGYLVFTGLGPLAVLAAVSALSGVALKSMWGYAFAAVLPVLAVIFAERRGLPDGRAAAVLRHLAFAALAVQAVVLALISACHASYRTCLDTADLSAKAVSVWKEATGGAAPSFVGGDIWLASQVSLNSEGRPRVVIDMDFRQCPWIPAETVSRLGAVVVTDDRESLGEYHRRFPGMTRPEEAELVLKPRFGGGRRRTVYFAVLPPSGSVMDR